MLFIGQVGPDYLCECVTYVQNMDGVDRVNVLPCIGVPVKRHKQQMMAMPSSHVSVCRCTLVSRRDALKSETPGRVATPSPPQILDVTEVEKPVEKGLLVCLNGRKKLCVAHGHFDTVRKVSRREKWPSNWEHALLECEASATVTHLWQKFLEKV